MSKRAKSRMLPQPPTVERLAAMRDALYAVASEGAKLDVAMCVEISRALIYINALLTPPRRGRPASDQRLKAAIVRDLIDEYDATEDEAVYAVLPRGVDQQSRALKRAYQRMREQEREYGVQLIILGPAITDPFVARLPIAKRDKKRR